LIMVIYNFCSIFPYIPFKEADDLLEVILAILWGFCSGIIYYK